MLPALVAKWQSHYPTTHDVYFWSFRLHKPNLNRVRPPSFRTISNIARSAARSGLQKLDSTISASSGQATILAADS